MVWYNDQGTSSSTTGAWYCWTANSTTYVTSSTDSSVIWGTWNGGTLDVTSDTPTTWSNWVITPTECSPGYVNGERVVLHEETEEEKQKREQERLRMEELAKEREKKDKEAEERSLSLLKENLTENQTEVFKTTGIIPVECQSGRKYHIRKGISANVHELNEKGETARRLCFHPSNCPVYDVMLAQKLMLEACEEDARRIANYS